MKDPYDYYIVEPPMGAGTKALMWGLITLTVVTVAWAVGTGFYIVITMIEAAHHG